MARTRRALAAVLLLTALIGCGKDEPPAPVVKATPTPAADNAAAPVKTVEATAPVNAADGATITGKVIFEGTPPPQKKVDMSVEPHCANEHADGAPREDVVVNPNGTLKNVLICIRRGLEGKKFALPAEPVVLLQKGCTYTPHLLGIMVGQTLIVRNGDPLTHNIHGLPVKNSEFNFGQSKQGMENSLVFDAPEVLIRVKCDVHPWMQAWIGVLADPFFAVTGDDGTFTLKGLPPGTYTVGAWHEKLKPEQTQEVTLGAKEKKELNFKFKP